jgi:hypothetical protein
MRKHDYRVIPPPGMSHETLLARMEVGQPPREVVILPAGCRILVAGRHGGVVFTREASEQELMLDRIFIESHPESN